MNKALQGMAQQIAHGLLLNMESPPRVERPTSASILELLLQQLTEEVARQLEGTNGGKELSDENVVAKLQKVESKLAKRGITVADDDKDEDEVAGTGSSFPNLKYAKPKYKNVESILRYVESDEDKGGGVKLVIMNFND